MFTGIIEKIGRVEEIESVGNNLRFTISSEVAEELKVDESVSHNGICLTVESVNGHNYTLSAVQETILKTNIKYWKEGDSVNLERAMLMNGRLDGHIVQGHVDDVAQCISRIDLNGSWEFTFKFDEQFGDLMIEKGSVCLNGVSLTAYNVGDEQFTVSIIPYTFEHTNLNTVVEGDFVNIEFDILGKYVQRMLRKK